MIYTPDEAGNYAKPLVVGMDEPTPLGLFTDLALDWGFLTASDK